MNISVDNIIFPLEIYILSRGVLNAEETGSLRMDTGLSASMTIPVGSLRYSTILFCPVAGLFLKNLFFYLIIFLIDIYYYQ